MSCSWFPGSCGILRSLTTVISMCVEGRESGTGHSLGDRSHLACQGTNKAAFAERWMRNSQGFVLSNGKFYKSEGKGSIWLEKEQNWVHRTEQETQKTARDYGNIENNDHIINNKNKTNGSKWWQNNPLLFWKKETNNILIAYQTHQPTTDKLRNVKINFFSKPGMVVHAWHLNTREVEYEDWKFKVILGCVARFRTSLATWKPSSKFKKVF